jgi:MFS transporter, PPP family, 3-phenylpropionic acid transporter
MVANFLVSRFLQFNKTEPQKNSWQTFTRLLENRRWVLFLVLSFTGGISLGLLNNYLFPTMQQLGAGEAMMGLALTVGTIAEVPIMFFSDRLIKRFGASSLIKLAILITAARFMLYFAFQTPSAFLLVQLINGLTFPLFWISGVSYADQHAPPGLRTTTQGLFAALVWGFGNAAGGFLGGPLFEILGGQQLFFAFGAAFLLILAVSELVERRYQAVPANK